MKRDRFCGLKPPAILKLIELGASDRLFRSVAPHGCCRVAGKGAATLAGSRVEAWAEAPRLTTASPVGKAAGRSTWNVRLKPGG